jgi:hypothetical protein
VGGKVELTSALARTVVPLFGGDFEVRLTSDGLPDWLAPSLAIGARQSWPAVVETPAGSSELSWTAATVRLCPVRVGIASKRLDVAPCAEANAGVLHAESRDIPDARRTASQWFDLGGSLRVVYRIGESWGVGAAALVTAPFIRHRFALAGGGLISQAPAVGITGGLVLELRL